MHLSPTSTFACSSALPEARASGEAGGWGCSVCARVCAQAGAANNSAAVPSAYRSSIVLKSITAEPSGSAVLAPPPPPPPPRTATVSALSPLALAAGGRGAGGKAARLKPGRNSRTICSPWVVLRAGRVVQGTLSTHSHRGTQGQGYSTHRVDSVRVGAVAARIRLGGYRAAGRMRRY